jgi:hypothetical protein
MMLFPSPIRNYIIYTRSTHFKFFNKLFNCALTLFILCSYQINFIFSKFRSGIQFSRTIDKIRSFIHPSAFRHHIRDIIFLSAQEKMIGVYTRCVITSMTYIHTFWYGTKMNFIRYSMGVLSNSFYTNFSIPIFSFSSNPFPTRMLRDSFYFIPKVFHNAEYTRHTVVCQGGF